MLRPRLILAQGAVITRRGKRQAAAYCSVLDTLLSVEPPSTTMISSGAIVCRASESSKFVMLWPSFNTVQITDTFMGETLVNFFLTPHYTFVNRNAQHAALRLAAVYQLFFASFLVSSPSYFT